MEQVTESVEPRISARVKWFDETKGYGFLVVEGRKSDVFVHRQQLVRSGLSSLTEGDKVTFVLQSGKKGDFAVQLSKL